MNSCPNCGGTNVSEYCADCGQHIVAKQSVWRWIREFAAEQFSLTARLPKTLWALFRRPGMLSAEWSAGRRARYIDPVRMFLLALVVGLTVSTIFGTRALISTPGEPPILIDLDPRIRDKARLAVILATLILVPIMALLIKVLILPRRTWYVDHLVFSIHFASMTLFIIALSWPVERFASPYGFAMAVGWSLIYLVLALQRVYSLKSGVDALRAFALLVIMAIIARGVIVSALKLTNEELLLVQREKFLEQWNERRAARSDSIFLVTFAGFERDSVTVPQQEIERAADVLLRLDPDLQSQHREAQTALLLYMAGDHAHGFRHCRESLSGFPTSPILLATCLRIAREMRDSTRIKEYSHRLLASRYPSEIGRSPTHSAILPEAVRFAKTITPGPRSAR